MSDHGVATLKTLFRLIASGELEYPSDTRSFLQRACAVASTREFFDGLALNAGFANMSI